MIPGVRGAASVAIVGAVAGGAHEPILEALPHLLHALSGTAIAAVEVAVITLLSHLNDAIATTRHYREEQAPLIRVATVRRALVGILAHHSLASHARSPLATVAVCAKVSIVTGARNGLVYAQQVRVAIVEGAHTFVITVHGGAGHTVEAGTLVVNGARVTIVATSAGGLIDAAFKRVARIGGALIPVIAIQRRSRLALTTTAVVFHRAG